MLNDTKGYEERVADITGRAREIRATMLDPVLDDNGGIIASSKDRQDRLKRAASNSIFESLGDDAPMILGIGSRAIRAYMDTYKRVPSDEILASVHQSVENVIKLPELTKGMGGIFESIAKEMSTSDGIIMRNRMLSICLPVTLFAITSQMVTLIPGQFNQSEIFRVHRVAGSTFGDLTKGDRIDQFYNGRYAVMDQMSKPMAADGAKTEFKFDTATDVGTQMPVKPRSVKILHDRNIVGSDDGNGYLQGVFELEKADGTTSTINITGKVDYATGTVNAKFSEAPASGLDIHIGYDVDIEKAPSLIPLIDHTMESRVIYPHEAAIASSVTIQALWGLRREFGLDADNMAMAGMRNLLAADKDRKILRDLYFYAKGEVTWNRVGPEYYRLSEHLESLKAALMEVDSQLILKNGFSGLVGIVGDPLSVNIFRYMTRDYFDPAPGYRNIPQPHYVGRAFDNWDLYCDPHQEPYTCLCFARGIEHGRTAFLAGDAVPAITFRHPVLSDLRNSSTLWELAYRDLQPFDGRNYLMKLRLVDDGADAGTDPGTGKDETTGDTQNP